MRRNLLSPSYPEERGKCYTEISVIFFTRMDGISSEEMAIII
jgi:hypothetical protein